MSGVFISYQKSSTRHMVGRLNASLTRRFGAKKVFRDDASLRSGEKWWPRISSFIEQADVMLVVMGTDWLEHLRTSNAESEDGAGWVQQEILLAKQHAVGIIPVLVDDAKMPAPDELPAEIADLSDLQAKVVSDRTFEHDVEDLGDTLEADYDVSDTRTTIRRWWERFETGLIVGGAILGAIAAGLTIWVFVRGDNRPPIISCPVRLEAVAGVPKPADISSCVDDPDGDELTIVADAQSDRSATILDQGDGNVTYTAPVDVFGDDQFGYEAVDGDGGTAEGMVFVNVAAGAMNRDLNVAVAELTAVGDAQAELLGRATTETLVALVADGMEEETRLTVDVAGPDRTGVVVGVTFDEQDETVVGIAERLNAHVVIYGVVSVDGSTTVELRMYLSPLGLDQAMELAGPYPLREASVSSTSSAAVGLELKAIVEPTVQAIADLSRGLAFYQINRYSEAEEALLAASSAWPTAPGASNGEEVLLQLLGNVTGELGRLDEAAGYFQQAVDLVGVNARARFGLNEVRFLQAGGPRCGAPGEPSLTALDEVAEEFAAIQELPEPEGSFLHARSQAEVGRVRLCQSLNGSDRVDDARVELQAVIDEYGSVGELEDLVGEAHQALGFSYLVTKDYSMAIEQYRAAIAITNEESRRAFFHGTIGGIYECDLEDLEKARVEYELSDSLLPEPLERRDCSAVAPGD